ncbi:helix-turn-helix transcriptional regulator [Streptomyces albus]|uniref:helix-turn-helix domain-containing protein n=1 Tax=Streptomyces albus TaxID=1888 RepID=UPI0033DB8044
MPAGGRPTMRSRRLGSALRRLREAARLDQQQAAEYIGGSKAKISRVEAGQVAARPGDVRLLLELYGVQDPDVSRHLEQLARDSNKRGWWLNYVVPDGFGDYVALEEDATCIRSWQPLLIPGLLQSPEYTRTLVEGNPNVTDPALAEQVVKVRQERRQRVFDSGTRFTAVIGEAALASRIPSRAVHLGQLADLLESAQRPHVTVQVLPAAEWHITRCAPGFVMLSFDGEWSPAVVSQDIQDNIVIAEGSEQIARYATAFEACQATALTPGKSEEYIRDLLERLSEEPTQQ